MSIGPFELQILAEAFTRAERKRVKRIIGELMENSNPHSTHGKSRLVVLRQMLELLESADAVAGHVE